MPRILITGAAGFLGSHLCDRFLHEGYEVVAMDNLITGDLRNLAHLHALPGFTFVHHDVSSHIHLNGPLDYLLHFASPASPIDYLKIPIQTLKVGSLGTHNCLGLAMAKGARMLIASTSEVYGDPQVHPQTEEYWGHVNPVGPRGVYDEAKRFQEAMTMAYHRYHGLETRIVRIFNTYGPRMRLNDGRVLPAFIGQALRGEDLTLFGDGSQTRSFCYVDDLVEGIYRLLLSDYAEPVNMGNPDEITIKAFAEEIIKLTGTDQKIVYQPLPKDDPTFVKRVKFWVGNQRLAALKGWPGRMLHFAHCPMRSFTSRSTETLKTLKDEQGANFSDGGTGLHWRSYGRGAISQGL
jgi:dTDP-glucose 4,6-dehydratase